jgi:hypothetical protein
MNVKRASNEITLYFEDHLNKMILQKVPVLPEELKEVGRTLIKLVLQYFKKKITNFDVGSSKQLRAV